MTIILINRPGGKVPVLQLEDCLRHGNASRKSKQRCSFHEEALKHFVGATSEAAPSKSEDATCHRGVAVSQLRAALDILWSPLAGQGAEYTKRCQDYRRWDGQTTWIFNMGSSAHEVYKFLPPLMCFQASSGHDAIGAL